MPIAIRAIAVLIALFGVAATVFGIGSLLIVENSVSIMQQMREAGSRTLDGIDFSAMRIVLYVNAALITLFGLLSLISGVGIFFKKNWARLLWIGTLFLMLAWIMYSLVVSSMNRGFDATNVITNVLIIFSLGAIVIFFYWKRTKDFFEVN